MFSEKSIVDKEYDAENPPADIVYALNQLQTLALETVLEKPQTLMSYETAQQIYGCKFLTQVCSHCRFPQDLGGLFDQ